MILQLGMFPASRGLLQADSGILMMETANICGCKIKDLTLDLLLFTRWLLFHIPPFWDLL